MEGECVIGVGVDIIEIERFMRIAQAAPGGVATRLFTSGELAGGRAGRAEYLASRFAAKEAVMKSLGRGMDGISFTDIEIVQDERGRPMALLGGSAGHVAREAGVRRVLLSISHSRDYACAAAVAVGGGGHEPGDTL